MGVPCEIIAWSADSTVCKQEAEAQHSPNHAGGQVGASKARTARMSVAAARHSAGRAAVWRAAAQGRADAWSQPALLACSRSTAQRSAAQHYTQAPVRPAHPATSLATACVATAAVAVAGARLAGCKRRARGIPSPLGGRDRAILARLSGRTRRQPSIQGRADCLQASCFEAAHQRRKGKGRGRSK